MSFKTGSTQIDGSINIDGSIFQWQQLFSGGGGGGGTGDVAWGSGNVGTNNQIITASGDGSIVAETNLTFDGNYLTIIGDVSFNSSADRTIGMMPSNTVRTLNILGNPIIDGGNSGGHVSIRGGGGSLYGGDVSIRGGDGGSGAGDIYIEGGVAGGGGGNILIKGGYSSGASGGNITIAAGDWGASTAGDISIGAFDTYRLYLSRPGGAYVHTGTIVAGPATITSNTSHSSGNAIYSFSDDTTKGIGGSGTGPSGIVEIIIDAGAKLKVASGGTYIANDLSIGDDIFVNGMDAAVTDNVVYYDTTSKQLTYGAPSAADISTLSIESYVNTSTYYDSSIRYRTMPEPSTGFGSGNGAEGLFVNFKAANTISSYYCGYIDTGGRIALADADASNMMPAVAINTTGSSLSAGTNYNLLIYGVVRNTAWNFAIGQPVYVGLSGEVTTTMPSSAPDCVQVIGRTVSPDSIIFNPSPDFVVLK